MRSKAQFQSSEGSWEVGTLTALVNGEKRGLAGNEAFVKEKPMPLLTWFLGFGFFDLLVGAIAAYALHAPVKMLLVLLPTLTLWGDNPDTPHGLATMMAGLLVFGGSFLLYGLAGIIVGLITRIAIGSIARSEH